MFCLQTGMCRLADIHDNYVCLFAQVHSLTFLCAINQRYAVRIYDKNETKI